MSFAKKIDFDRYYISKIKNFREGGSSKKHPDKLKSNRARNKGGALKTRGQKG